MLLLLIFGIVEFGRGYQAKAALTSAVREGARSLAIGVGNPTAVVASAAPLLHANQLTVTTSASPCLTGTQATVTATYPFTYNIPFFPAATLTLSATGAMLCEQ
jgi:Flp pilus assembly protein TadG